MKHSRFYGRLAGPIALALVVGACSGSATAAPSSGDSAAASPSSGAASPAASSGSGAAPYIAIVSKGSQQQFWQAVQKGAADEAAAKGATITFEGPAAESEVDKQLTMLQTALDKHPAALCFAALDSKAATPYMQKAKDAGIPVVGFDSGVDSPIPVTTVATDNIAAAGAAADEMAKAIGGSGEVAIVVHDQTSQTGITRRDGFVNQIKAKYPNIQVVDIQYGAGDPVKSADLAKAIMTAHPNLKGFFGANEGSIKGVLNALKETSKEGKIVAIGYDSGQQQIDAINSGAEYGAITQNPVGIGAKCVDAALAAIAGTAQPKTIDTGYFWYDKTNINDAKIQAVLYK
jgi:ribose transport system substrate-binding protein